MSYSCLINTAACLAVFISVCVCVSAHACVSLCVRFGDVGQALRNAAQKSIIALKHINAGGTN